MSNTESDGLQQASIEPSLVGDCPAESKPLSTEPLRRKSAQAAILSGASEGATRVLTIVLSIATARFMTPAQVGVLGLAVIVIGIVSLIAACSETAGVIGRGYGDDKEYALATTGLRFTVVGLLLGACYLLLPVITSGLAGDDDLARELSDLIRLLICVPVLECCANYPRVLLQRRLELSFLAVASLVQVMVHVLGSLALLFLGFGTKGVVLASVASTGVSCILLWSRFFGVERLMLSLPGRKVGRQIVHDTSKVLAGGFIGYLNGRVDNLLVAAAIGPASMGFYGMAWSASRVASQILGQAMGFVLVPALAKIRDDKDRVYRALIESVKNSYLLLAPCSACLFAAAPGLVSLVLGTKWLPIVPCLRVMSITVLVSPLVSASHAALVATGRAHLTALATIGQLVVLGSVIVPFSQKWGIVGAAYGDLAAVAALTAIALACTPLLRSALTKSSAAILLVPIGSAAVACGLAMLVSSAADASLRLAIELAVLLTSYPVLLSLFGGRAAILELLVLSRSVIQRIPPAARVSPSHS